MTFIKRYSIFLFLIVAGVLFSLVHLWFPETKESQSPEVVISNEFRRKHGIPVIESDWIREDLDQAREKWHDGIRGINTIRPIHLQKEIVYNGDIVQAEEDDFHFKFSDSLQYRLIIDHEYLQNSSDVKRTMNKLIIYHPSRFPPSHSETLSNEDADSVLRVWEMEF